METRKKEVSGVRRRVAASPQISEKEKAFALSGTLDFDQSWEAQEGGTSIVTKRRDSQDTLAIEVEKIQESLRRCIEETRRLSDRSEALLSRVRKEPISDTTDE
jgi:hypothetical protein